MEDMKELLEVSGDQVQQNENLYHRRKRISIKRWRLPSGWGKNLEELTSVRGVCGLRILLT